MRFQTRSSLVALMLGAGSVLGQNASAQVQLFDHPPSVNELRNILVPKDGDVPMEPETRGASRRIVIGDPNAVKPPQQTTNASLRQGGDDTQSAPQQQAAPQQRLANPPSETMQPAPVARKTPKVENRLASAPDEAVAVGVRVNFANNSAVIPPDAYAYLSSIAELLKQERGLVLAVEGHTDARGSAEYNMTLSQRRAAAVATYLERKGVSAEQLVTVGKGKMEPLVENGLDARNRRVQFNRVNFSG